MTTWQASWIELQPARTGEILRLLQVRRTSIVAAQDVATRAEAESHHSRSVSTRLRPVILLQNLCLNLRLAHAAVCVSALVVIAAMRHDDSVTYQVLHRYRLFTLLSHFSPKHFATLCLGSDRSDLAASPQHSLPVANYRRV